jgi:uncharacterized damage-inducible protein DinB
MVNRKDLVVPEFFNKYINTVEEDDLRKALSKNTRQFLKLLKHIPKKKINYAYAEGKWTLKETLQHVIDAERVFVFRALNFARKDPHELPGFDENTWAVTAMTSKRKWNDLVEEFKALRAANELFFASLDDEQLLNTGIASKNPISVAALGFIVAGHATHHVNLIKERYLGEKPPAAIKKENGKKKKNKKK